VAHQRSTNGKQVGRDGGLEAEGAISGGESEVEAEDEREWKQKGEPEGFPLQAWLMIRICIEIAWQVCLHRWFRFGI